MSFLNLKKEKDAVNALMREVTEFVDSTGEIYDAFEKKKAEEIMKSLPVVETSLLFKLKNAENLQNTVLEMLENEKRAEKRALLTDLLAILDKERRHLGGIRSALHDLRSAKEAEKVISENEEVRKFRMAVGKMDSARKDVKD